MRGRGEESREVGPPGARGGAVTELTLHRPHDGYSRVASVSLFKLAGCLSLWRKLIAICGGQGGYLRVRCLYYTHLFLIPDSR